MHTSGRRRLTIAAAIAGGAALLGIIAIVLLTLGPGQGGTQPKATPTASASISLSPSTSSSPSPTSQPSASPTASNGTLVATVVGAGGTNIRIGPGMDMAIVGSAPKGAVLSFNGWYRRADDPAQPDAITGRIEAWSRDWLRLLDGRGWIHDAMLNARPLGLPLIAWTPPKPTPTTTPTVTIAAPIYHQTMNLDCETSALRVALAYYGHYYTDAQLFADEPVDLRAPVMGPNRTILQWGNPYTHFVGDVNGVAAIPTGYGVYYPVILNLAHSHGLPNAVGGEGYRAATIYAELQARHPVEVWVEYDWNHYQAGVWTAWDATKVRYTFGEHALTLTGVSTTQVRVNDVGHGTQYWIDKATFEASWASINNMAVIFK